MTQDQDLTERFIGALAQLEEGREVEPLVALHGDDADVGNINVPEQFHGPDGVRRFWTEYRGTFDTMKSEFRNVIATPERIALEWTTRGTSVEGKPVEYDGVSILEVNGNLITRFRAYFNPRDLGRQMSS